MAAVGTPFTLTYTSDRMPGRASARSLDLAASGATVPAGLKSIETQVLVAGQVFEQSFAPQPNLASRYRPAEAGPQRLAAFGTKA